MKTFLKDLYIFICVLGLAYSFKYMYTESLWWIIGVIIFFILITWNFYNEGYNCGEEYGALGWIKRDIEIKIEEQAKEQQDWFEVYINNKLINEYITALKHRLYLGVGNKCPYVITSISVEEEESIVTFTKIKYFEDD